MARARIEIPELDADGQFFFDPTAALEIECVGCGCTENNACPGGRCWIAVNRPAGVGICSSCAAKPLDELLTGVKL